MCELRGHTVGLGSNSVSSNSLPCDWTIYLALLCLDLLIFKMKRMIVIIAPHRIAMRIEEVKNVKYLAQYLTIVSAQ